MKHPKPIYIVCPAFSVDALILECARPNRRQRASSSQISAARHGKAILMISNTEIRIGPPDRNLAMELVRATEAAAIRAVPFIGSGDKASADRAAVDAMRTFLRTVDFDGLVVIGEGEKDNAPMLYNGERVGTGRGPACDIAVDPIDGTSLTAAGRRDAISMLAVADRGSMLDASMVFYMDKIVTSREGIGVVDIRKPIRENIRALAKAKAKPVGAMQVAVLDRPRHAWLIEELRRRRGHMPHA